MPRDTRTRRDMHALDAEGMVACNPRDREATHRAEHEGIATDDPEAVTCPACLTVLHRQARAKRASGVTEPSDANAETAESAGDSVGFVRIRDAEKMIGSVCEGAGRVMSRSEAGEKILTRDLQSRMRKIVYRRQWSARFRDEAPQAYRELHEVMQAQRQLVRTTAVLSPILNDKRP